MTSNWGVVFGAQGDTFSQGFTEKKNQEIEQGVCGSRQHSLLK